MFKKQNDSKLLELAIKFGMILVKKLSLQTALTQKMAKAH